MGDTVGSDGKSLMESEFFRHNVKLEVVGGKPDHVTYVIQSSWTVPATMLLSVVLVGPENGSQGTRDIESSAEVLAGVVSLRRVWRILVSKSQQRGQLCSGD